ncbi:hypothetical protein LMG24238_06214 [Paraburkholderia sediminicola]|uniref:Uncharacterized protein n=2 Tax=Paraburkholderia sediminicola TaxID=458836 RepID=A0A6J5CIJ9_9BURK|nr:hypothetical protein LMG24238_06214 [Paraburkholderia sediminicola]
MRRRSIVAVVSIVIAAFVAAGLGWSAVSAPQVQQGKEQMQPNLVFGLGDDSDQIMREAKVPIKKSHIATALMYDASRIATGVEPVFQLRDPKHGVVFPQTTDVEFMSDTEEGGKIRTIHLRFKVPTSPKDVHDTAAFDTYDEATYRYVMDVIARVNAAGWKRYIPLSTPRLEGLDTYVFEPAGYGGRTFVSPSSIVYGDPNYKLTLDQWKHLSRGNSVTWRWYSDGAFIDLTYAKDHRSPELPIVLGDQLDAEIQSEASWLDLYGATYEAGRAKYQSLVPKFMRERTEAEAKARAQGARVLTDWKDPSIAGVTPPND